MPGLQEWAWGNLQQSGESEINHFLEFLTDLANNLLFQPKPESLLTPDGVCEDGEGWGCIGEIASEYYHDNQHVNLFHICLIAATVMDCIAEIGMDPQGVQKCVAVSVIHKENYVILMWKW